jgi:hypothetical protein
VGGRQGDDGVWRWTDGTLVGEVAWRNDAGSSPLCFNLFNGESPYRESCILRYKFFCESNMIPVTSGSTTLRYQQQQLTFPSIDVWYKYIAPNKPIVDAWADKRMTGFGIGWWIQDQNGTRMSEMETDTSETWKAMRAEPRFHDTNLQRMVELARRARLEGLTGEEAVGRAILDKYKMMIGGAIDYGQCAYGQVKITGQKPFDQINLALFNVSNNGDISAEDIRTGYAIYMVTVMCKEVEALNISQFLGTLVLTQTPRTIIQATVNTIHQETMEGKNRKRLGLFYQELNKTFNFHHGQILVALSSPSELEAMLARDLPYLTPYTQQIMECVRGTSCQGVTDLIENLGINMIIFPFIFHAPLPQTRPPEK